MTPRVSIILPAYNRRGVLKESVDSCLAQTLQEFEVIVVDDGSSDGTAQFVREAYAADPRVRLAILPQNGGPASARNHGIEMARGDLVGVLDSDDRYLPRFLESHVEALDARPDIELTISDVRFEGAWPTGWTTTFARRPPPRSGADMCRGAWVVPCSLMVRADVIRELRFEPGRRLVEDTELMFRFFDRGYRVWRVPEVLSVYRRLPSGQGEPHVTADKRRVRHASLLLEEEYAHLATDPVRHRIRLSRRWAKHHLEGGERSEAARRARAWWRARPWDARAAWTLLRSILPSRS